MKKILLLSAIIISGMLLSSWTSMKPARGLEDEIYVVADSTEFEALKPVMDSTFEKIINTPQPEKLFTLKELP